MPVIPLSLSLRGATASAVHPADAEATDGWSLARLPGPLRFGATPRSSVASVHGVVGHFVYRPPPAGTASFWLDSVICIVLSAPVASCAVCLGALPLTMPSVITA
jgi:hypothetical protein